MKPVIFNIFLIVLPVLAFSQNDVQGSPKSSGTATGLQYDIIKPTVFQQKSTNFLKPTFYLPKSAFTPEFAIKPRFLNFYTMEGAPFFCKVEWQMEKAVKFSFKFRLGEVEYVEMLEGKR